MTELVSVDPHAALWRNFRSIDLQDSAPQHAHADQVLAIDTTTPAGIASQLVAIRWRGGVDGEAEETIGRLIETFDRMGTQS
jgi:hypothetical protein